MNTVPDSWCWNCQDYGIIEILDPSTDGLLGYITCNCRGITTYRHPQPWKPNVKELATLPPF